MYGKVLTIFNYRQNPEGQFFPVIPLRLHFKKTAIDSSALIDSGASVSIFKEEIAKELGLVLTQGRKISLGGVGGKIKGYLHLIRLEIAQNKFLCPVVFSQEYRVSLNLLGREAFFDQFTIVFEEKKKQVRLE